MHTGSADSRLLPGKTLGVVCPVRRRSDAVPGTGEGLKGFRGSREAARRGRAFHICISACLTWADDRRVTPSVGALRSSVAESPASPWPS